jgi:hypothetical protein
MSVEDVPLSTCWLLFSQFRNGECQPVQFRLRQGSCRDNRESREMQQPKLTNKGNACRDPQREKKCYHPVVTTMKSFSAGSVIRCWYRVVGRPIRFSDGFGIDITSGPLHPRTLLRRSHRVALPSHFRSKLPPIGASALVGRVVSSCGPMHAYSWPPTCLSGSYPASFLP